eukprot:2861141-Pleurochrysis_carterae.AAC.2
MRPPRVRTLKGERAEACAHTYVETAKHARAHTSTHARLRKFVSHAHERVRARTETGEDRPHACAGYFLTKIFHPNVSKTGEICVNTLKKDWSSSLGIGHVLQVGGRNRRARAHSPYTPVHLHTGTPARTHTHAHTRARALRTHAHARVPSHGAGWFERRSLSVPACGCLARAVLSRLALSPRPSGSCERGLRDFLTCLRLVRPRPGISSLSLLSLSLSLPPPSTRTLCSRSRIVFFLHSVPRPKKYSSLSLRKPISLL